jgi:hypothetical protein
VLLFFILALIREEIFCRLIGGAVFDGGGGSNGGVPGIIRKDISETISNSPHVQCALCTMHRAE